MCSVKTCTSWVLILTGIAHVSVPMARGCALEGLKDIIFFLLHAKVGHNLEYWGTHGTPMLLSVETFTVLKISSGGATVQ